MGLIALTMALAFSLRGMASYDIATYGGGPWIRLTVIASLLGGATSFVAVAWSIAMNLNWGAEPNPYKTKLLVSGVVAIIFFILLPNYLSIRVFQMQHPASISTAI